MCVCAYAVVCVSLCVCLCVGVCVCDRVGVLCVLEGGCGGGGDGGWVGVVFVVPSQCPSRQLMRESE